jgi:hypothetical protein
MWHKQAKRAPKDSGGGTSGARNGPLRNSNATSNNASKRKGHQQPYKTYKMLALQLEAEKAKTAKALHANVVKRKPPTQQQQQQLLMPTPLPGHRHRRAKTRSWQL